MERSITGFRRDAAGDWTALLGCGHSQHVRHDPPFVDRPWVLSVEGRAERLGESLNCVRCERMELPSHFVAYHRTPEFSADSMPSALRADHATGLGVWAKIVVTRGTVRYCVPDLALDAQLGPGHDGIVVPEARHSVDPAGDARFHVEFYHAPNSERNDAFADAPG